jgi:hypothetical protein
VRTLVALCVLVVGGCSDSTAPKLVDTGSPTCVSDAFLEGVDTYRNSVTITVVDEAARVNVINALNGAGLPCNLIRTVIGPLPEIRIAR